MKTKFIFPYYLKKEEYKYWNLYSDDFLNYFFVKNLDYDKIVYFHPEEPNKLINDHNFYNNLSNLLSHNNVELEIWLGNYEKRDERIINWPYFLTNFSYYFYQLCHIKHNYMNFDRGYVFLNRRSRLHRAIMIDKIYEYNLQNFGYISWHNIGFDSYGSFNLYKFNYFNNEIKQFDNLYSNDFENQENGFCINFNEYFKGLVNLVAETNCDIKDISEKTWFTILHNKPFLILGSKGINHTLVDLGFELYDEIFDYSFDFEENLEIKTTMIAENLIKLKYLDLNRVYEKLYPKINYNRNVLINIIKNQKLVPNKFYEYLETSSDEDKYYLNLYKTKIDCCYE